MSLSICSLSGKLLEHPVISKKTGHAYEKELILKHIETTGQCPITGQEMSQDDLIEVNTENLITQPRKSEHNDTTNILKKIQGEWDTLLLENFQIKKALKETKEEIAHNLYQHEAANLVICRLIKERDEALSQLNYIKSQLEETNKEEEEQLENSEEFDFMGIYDELVDRINDMSQTLIAKRRKREISKNLKSTDEIKNFKVKGSYPIHSSSKPGITCVDIHPYHSNLILTGGVDTRAVIFDSDKEATLYSTDRGHNKKINSVKFYPSEDILGFCMASQDNSASFWLRETSGNHNFNFVERYKTNVHKGPVTSLSFHPLKEYALIASRDAHWSFHSLFKGVCLAKIKTETENEITKADFHPDGKNKIKILF
jgi:pre-mRNA-processing factor 19